MTSRSALAAAAVVAVMLLSDSSALAAPFAGRVAASLLGGGGRSSPPATPPATTGDASKVVPPRERGGCCFPMPHSMAFITFDPVGADHMLELQSNETMDAKGQRAVWASRNATFDRREYILGDRYYEVDLMHRTCAVSAAPAPSVFDTSLFCVGNLSDPKRAPDFLEGHTVAGAYIEIWGQRVLPYSPYEVGVTVDTCEPVYDTFVGGAVRMQFDFTDTINESEFDLPPFCGHTGADASALRGGARALAPPAQYGPNVRRLLAQAGR